MSEIRETVALWIHAGSTWRVIRDGPVLRLERLSAYKWVRPRLSLTAEALIVGLLLMKEMPK